MNLFSYPHINDWECGRGLGAFLYGLVMLMRSEIVLEFGTFKGYSALCLAKGIEEAVLSQKLPSSSRVITFDVKDYPKIPKFEGNPFIEFRLGDSRKQLVREVYLKHKEKCRIVFFDTKHYYEHVKEEFENVQDIVGENTLILFHDMDTGYQRHTAHLLLKDIRDGKYNTSKFYFQSICIPTRWSDDYCLKRNRKDGYGRRLSDGIGVIRKEIIRK